MNPLTATVPWTDSPFFEQMLQEKQLSPKDEALVRAFHRDGYVVLDDFLTPDQCVQIRDEVEPLYRPDEPEGPRSRYRVQDAYAECPSVRRLAADSRMLDFLRLLYEREPFPFQTLNFKYGTQQPAHSDTQHFSSVPFGFMAGVWVALEDITTENGPLLYYPGSHRIPDVDLLGIDPSRFVECQQQYLKHLDAQFERVEFTAKQGQALIWSARLWHGGAAITKEGATRHSQVTHYYFRDCIYFAPQNSAFSLGRFKLKEAVDISTGETVPHRYNDLDLEVADAAEDITALRPRKA